ncbi:MAG: ComEA family DNA-binding protein [Pseudomonadota bacterium]
MIPRTLSPKCAQRSKAFETSTVTARPEPFRRCMRMRRRPLLSALLMLTAPLALEAAPPVFAQDAPPVELREAETARININTASATELADTLSGIGGARAEAIVRYREQFGPFESIEELSEVSGIGSATVERNRDVLRIR